MDPLFVIDVIDKIRDRLPNDIELNDNQIESRIEEIELVIKNYCAIPRVPEALKYTLINMTVDLLEYHIAKNIETEEPKTSDNINIEDVKSISVGDTSVSLGDTSKATEKDKALSSHKNYLDRIVMNYRAQLNQFRRLW